MATRFWPGADEEPGEPGLAWYLKRPSEWAHEREWRVRCTGEPPALQFDWQDLAFVIAPDPRWQSFVASYIGNHAGELYEREFDRIPTVVVAEDGNVIEDPHHIWIPSLA